jgi:hypothetical protein
MADKYLPKIPLKHSSFLNDDQYDDDDDDDDDDVESVDSNLATIKKRPMDKNQENNWVRIFYFFC